MIEGDLGIGGPAVPAERRLEVACALVHALWAVLASERPAAREEALAVLEQLTLPAAVFGAGPTPRFANGAWRAQLGARDGPFPGTHLDEVLRTGATLRLADLALSLDGRSERCAAILRPIRDGGDGGELTGVIVLCAVITDEVVARELAASAGALVWGGPVSGGPDYFNRAWEAYTGTPRRSARLDTLQDAIHPEDRSSYARAFGEATRAGAAELEARLRRAGGDHRWHHLRLAITPTSRWYAVAMDIQDARAEDERADLLARERAARADAEQASRAKDQFLAAVSHELRAPLTTMMLWERVLRDPAAGAALHAKALDAIQQSARSQSRLVGDLLDVSRAISGKLHLDLRLLDLERVLRGALEAIAPAALARQTRLERRGAAVLAKIEADEARLRQVLDNLLANAVKFTDPGGRIAVAVTRQERSVVIDIEDSGCGIAADFLPRIFDPFSQIDGDSLRTEGGLGLGLAIAKQIATLHHGELTAASAGPGLGATFTLRLPITDERRARSPLDGMARRPMLAHIRVLVIDDDRRVRDALALLLDRAGAVVETAETAELARIRIALKPPDVILCDVAMPGEDGNSFIRGLRASGGTMPAIALTAYAMEADVERALDAGFDLHVAKPIDFERLVESIGDLVAAQRADEHGDAATRR